MKARFLALSALVLGLASCQQDVELNGPVVGGEVDFQLKVDAKELATRAGENGEADEQNAKNSAYGAIDYYQGADWDAVDLRYTLEVYDADALEAAPVKDRMVKVVDSYEPVAFDLRLVPNREYRFVVFADFVEEGTQDVANIEYQSDKGLHHIIGSTLQNITIKEDAINDESTDAYFATKDITISNSAAQDIVLKRPYGKVRVIATDLDQLNINVEPGSIEVVYDANHAKAFNAVTGEISDEYVQDSYVYEYAELHKNVTDGGLTNHYYTVGYDELTDENDNGVERHTHMTLFTDYILATDTQKPVHFTMTVYDQDGNEIKTTHFSTDIPVERNHLTTIIGNVLTTATEINVTIDDNFEQPEYRLDVWDGKSIQEVTPDENGVYNIYEAAELAWFAQAVNKGNKFEGKIVKLCKDIHLNGEVWTPIGATVKFEGTFNGQNHVIEGLFVNMTDKTPAGLFGSAKYVKNLKVCHAEIYGHYKAGVIVGDGLCSRIDNCHVENATVVITPLNKDDANHAGGIVGYLSAENEAYVTNSSVKNATIIGYRDVAGIAGTANRAAVVVANNHIEDVTVIADQTAEYKEQKVANVDAVAGRVTTGATIEGNTVENADVYVLVNTANNLTYQVANTTRDIKVVLVGDVAGNATIKQREGINVLVTGMPENHSFDGVITVNGDARANGTETLKFEGVNFRTENNDFTFISAPSKIDNKYNYSHNVTIENCTFEGNHTVGCASFTGTYNFVMNNCVATNVHSIAQLQSVDNSATIQNVTVVDSKNGFSLGNIANATIEGVEIEALGYGIRLDGAKERTVSATIENSTISAFIPVNVRKMNNAACNVEVEFVGEDNTLIGTNYEIAFCSNEYEEGIAPAAPVGTFRLQNAEGFKAYYGDVTSFSALDAAVNSTNSDTVTVEGNITMVGKGVEVERDVVLDFNQHEYNAGSDANSRWYAIEAFGEYDVVLKNANFTRAGVYAGNGADVVFENGTINHKPERSSRYIFCAQSGATITVKDGTFYNDRPNNSFFWADNATIIVEGGNFGGSASNNKVVLTNGGQLIIKGGTFNFDPTAWVAEGYEATKSGSTWTVSAL